jgi:hypothetical protein
MICTGSTPETSFQSMLAKVGGSISLWLVTQSMIS